MLQRTLLQGREEPISTEGLGGSQEHQAAKTLLCRPCTCSISTSNPVTEWGILFIWVHVRDEAIITSGQALSVARCFQLSIYRGLLRQQPRCPRPFATSEWVCCLDGVGVFTQFVPFSTEAGAPQKHIRFASPAWVDQATCS